MPRTSVLSDELLRQLVAVGQVDVLVGVPTLNNAATIQEVVRTLHVGLAKHFPRERTVLISPDAGSDDGTSDLVRRAPMADAEMRGSSGLRTTHRVAAPLPGLPARAAGVRAVLAAADLLQARTVVLIDPDVTSLAPDWVAALAGPVWRNEADVVFPVHARTRFEGPLVTQLVRPLLAAAYARRLSSSLSGAVGCSGRFAARMAVHSMWDGDLARPSLDVWLLATALADDLRIVQAQLGPLVHASPGGKSSLQELFGQVVGTAFTCLDRHASTWLGREEPRDLPMLGPPQEPAAAEAPVDPSPMVGRFRSGVHELEPVLRDILTQETLARLQSAASAAEDPPPVPSALWVRTVYEFAASAHRAVMNHDHLTQALVPLYLGRTAYFFSEISDSDDAGHRARMAALESEYETLRPYLVERWKADGR